MEADAYPLTENILLRSGIAMFEGQLPSLPHASQDCTFLSSIRFVHCRYGASDCAIYPFVCVPRRPFTTIPTAAEIIAELHVARFQSEHIATFHTQLIPYPGYHPGTKNDEIHTDHSKQYMFTREPVIDEEEEEGDFVRLSLASHHALKGYVLDNHLFYLLLHDKPKQYGEFMYSHFVLLFAIGISSHTGNMVGAVTHQTCHNLCD